VGKLNVHIALIGKTKEPVLRGFQHYGMDKLYLLHSQDTKEFRFKQTAEEVRRILADAGFSKVILVEINPFDMHDIINSVIHIVEKEKQGSIYINITGGTNLMAGAACSASFFVGAKAYYVLDQSKLPAGSTLEDQILELPIPKIPYARTLEGTQMKIMRKILQYGGKVSNTTLRNDLRMSPQRMSYNIKELQTKGLVTANRGLEEEKLRHGRFMKRIDARRLAISLTSAGKLVASWTEI
jgi:hypothetical protein